MLPLTRMRPLIGSVRSARARARLQRIAATAGHGVVRAIGGVVGVVGANARALYLIHACAVLFAV